MRVSATTKIRATPEQVWDFIADVENDIRWQEAAVWTKVTTPGPVGLGTRVEHVGKMLGMRIPTTGAVTVFEPPRRFGYDATVRGLSAPMRMRYEIEPDDAGSRLTLSSESRLAGPMRLLEGVMRRNVQGMFERDVARLAEAVEAATTSDDVR